MSKGLGRIERKIIEILEYDRENEEDSDGRKTMEISFQSIGDILPRVYFDINHWRKLDKNEERYDPNYKEKEITRSMYQSVARAIRSLERKGHIVSKEEPGWLNPYFHGGHTYDKWVKLNV